MPVRALVVIAILIAFPAQSFGWSERTQSRIADKAAQLAPPDLRLLLVRFAPEYRRGLQAWKDDPAVEARHTYLAKTERGALIEMIESETQGAIRLMRSGGSVAEFVERLGRIAHLTADLNNPFHVANEPSRLMQSRADFEGFVDRKLEKFPTVFYGLQWPLALHPYLQRAASRTAGYYELLDEEYFRNGTRRSSSEFDDRSSGFGVASLSYSHAVTDVVHVYYHVWKEVGGDVRSASAMRRSNLLRND